MAAVIAVAVTARAASVLATETTTVDHRSHWELRRHFTLEVAADGLEHGVRLAWSGHSSGAEVAGAYLVGLRDGTVVAIGEGRVARAVAQIATRADRVELRGLCVAPDRSYAFTTYGERRRRGGWRSVLARFDFADDATGWTQRTLHRWGSDAATADAPAIGPCAVAGGSLFVVLGDGGAPGSSRSRRSVFGKVLRLDYDGAPALDNPWLSDRRVPGPSAYVWAVGLRAPTALALIGGHALVADAGTFAERLVRLSRGSDGLWDGDEWSLGASAMAFLAPPPAITGAASPSAAVVTVPPSDRDSLFVSLAGAVDAAAGGRAPTDRVPSGIVTFALGPRGDVPAVPKWLVRSRPDSGRHVGDLAFGAEGLHFLSRAADGDTSVVRLRYAPGSAYPFPLDAPALYDSPRDQRAHARMESYGCFSCHSMTSQAEGVAPSLERRDLARRLEERLGADAYRAQLDAVDALEDDYLESYRAARAEVRQARGAQRVRVWMRYHLLAPRFDEPHGRMPTLGVTEQDADAIGRYLLGEPAATESDGAVPARAVPEESRDRGPGVSAGGGGRSEAPDRR